MSAADFTEINPVIDETFHTDLMVAPEEMSGDSSSERL